MGSSAGLRVAQVACTDAFAGVERSVATLSRELTQAGCRVTVVGGDPERMPKELDGGVAEWLPADTPLRAAAALVRAGRFDVVHAHMTASELAVTLTRWRCGGVFVSTRHFAERRGKTVGGAIAAKAIRRATDLQLSISQFVASQIDGSSVVVHPGVPVDPDAAPGGRQRVVLVAQRLEAEKETHVAIEAWARSGLGRRGWNLHIAGGGREIGRLQALSRHLEVEGSCQFLGPCDDIYERYRQAAALIAPRRDEPFGLSVVEAMAACLPVVAAAGGGHLETVGKCPGARLFPPGDVEAAAGALVGLADDEAERQRYGQQLQVLQRGSFDVRRQGADTLAQYRRLVTARSPGREMVQ